MLKGIFLRVFLYIFIVATQFLYFDALFALEKKCFEDDDGIVTCVSIKDRNTSGVSNDLPTTDELSQGNYEERGSIDLGPKGSIRVDRSSTVETPDVASNSNTGRGDGKSGGDLPKKVVLPVKSKPRNNIDVRPTLVKKGQVGGNVAGDIDLQKLVFDCKRVTRMVEGGYMSDRGRKKFDIALSFTGNISPRFLSAHLLTGNVSQGEDALRAFDGSVSMLYGLGGRLQMNIGSEDAFFFINASGNVITHDSLHSNNGFDTRLQLGGGWSTNRPSSKFHVTRILGIDTRYRNLAPALSSEYFGASGYDVEAAAISQQIQSASDADLPELKAMKGRLTAANGSLMDAKVLGVGLLFGIRFTEYVGERHIFAQGVNFSVGPAYFHGNVPFGSADGNFGGIANFNLFFEHSILLKGSLHFRWFVDCDLSGTLAVSPRSPINLSSLNNMINNSNEIAKTLQSSLGRDGSVQKLLQISKVSILLSKMSIENLLDNTITPLVDSLQADLKALTDELLLGSNNVYKDLLDKINEKFIQPLTDNVKDITMGNLERKLHGIDKIISLINDSADDTAKIVEGLPIESELLAKVRSSVDTLLTKVNDVLKESVVKTKDLLDFMTGDLDPDKVGALLKDLVDHRLGKDTNSSVTESLRSKLDSMLDKLVSSDTPHSAEDIQSVVADLKQAGVDGTLADQIGDVLGTSRQDDIFESINNLTDELSQILDKASAITNDYSSLINPDFQLGFAFYPKFEFGVGLYWKF